MTKVRNVPELIEKRNKVLAKMKVGLKTAVDWLIDWHKNEDKHSLLKRWELGDLVKEVRAKYGQAAVNKLKLFLIEDPSAINKAEQFAEKYDKKQVLELCELVMADGYTHLSYSHIRILVSIDDAQLRKQAMDLTLEKCWTSSQLGTHVKSLFAKPRSNNPSGRGPATPKDALGVIKQQISFIDDFDSRNTRVWRSPNNSLSAKVAQISPQDYSDELEKKLGELAHRMQQLADEAVARATEAKRKFEEVANIRTLNQRKILPASETEWKEEEEKEVESAIDNELVNS